MSLIFRSHTTENPIAGAANDIVALPRPAASRPKVGARRRVLVVSSLISLPYRVMRVAHDAGADVYVLGNRLSACLRYSRYCKEFVLTQIPITGERSLELAEEINRWADAFDADMVLPGDAQATRALIATRDRIEVPCFPMPTLEQFDFLNDKWHFTNLCRELGVLCPQSWFVADADELRQRIEAGTIPLPAIVKPINHDGALGVLPLDATNVAEQLDKIDYAPIIVQEFIPGRDIGASVYCDKGEIKAFIAHELRRATYRALDDRRIYNAIAAILGPMKVNGVYNFDMRLTDDGRIYYLECNPRFFFKMNQSMVAGVNFVRHGLDGGGEPMPEPDAAVRMPKALVASLPTPWKVSRRDLKMLGYFWRDPISALREAIGIDWEYPADAHRRHFITPAIEHDSGKDDALVA